MRIAYVATDEVNQALAAQMADKCGAIVCHLRPGEVHPDGLFDAVLYNLDDMPRDERSAFLEGLCLGKPDRPTAVHGYDITDEQARTLNRNGVAASRDAFIPTCFAVCARLATEPRDRPTGRRPDGPDLGQPGQVTEPRFRPTDRNPRAHAERRSPGKPIEHEAPAVGKARDRVDAKGSLHLRRLRQDVALVEAPRPRALSPGRSACPSPIMKGESASRKTARHPVPRHGHPEYGPASDLAAPLKSEYTPRAVASK